jgi:tellurite resistance protein
MSTNQSQMLLAGKRTRPATVAFKDTDAFDGILQRRADQLGINKSELMRQIIHGAIEAQESKRDLRADPLVAEIIELHRVARMAVADGKITPVEREEITDRLVAALHDVRTRRSA